jgi:DoxX-like family
MSATQAIAITNSTVSESKGRLWTGRILTGPVVLFLLFDGVTKVAKERHVLQASAEMGYSANLIVGIGTLLLACVAVYLIPRIAVLGATLLTAYLGGAVEANVHAGHPIFECIFPVIFGVLVWAGLFLREPRLIELMPFRKRAAQQ